MFAIGEYVQLVDYRKSTDVWAKKEKHPRFGAIGQVEGPSNMKGWITVYFKEGRYSCPPSNLQKCSAMQLAKYLKGE